MSAAKTKLVNSLWPSDAIWRHRSGLTLVQVMACCLTAPSHYLNQCWLFISEIPWYSPGSNFTVSGPATILSDEFEHYTSKIAAISLGYLLVNQNKAQQNYVRILWDIFYFGKYNMTVTVMWLFTLYGTIPLELFQNNNEYDIFPRQQIDKVEMTFHK